MAHFSIMWQVVPDMAKLAKCGDCGPMPSTNFMSGGAKKPMKAVYYILRRIGQLCVPNVCVWCAKSTLLHAKSVREREKSIGQ